MSKRFKMSRRDSRKLFTRGAVKTRGLNLAMPMRGGFRI